MKSVYFVRRADGTGPIKIGCTKSMDQRLTSLEREVGASLTILGEAPGTFRDERRMHRQFAEHCTVGEWFHPSGAVMGAVLYVQQHSKLPPTSETDREVRMAARYLGGETLQAIADDYGLTRERVRQILRKAHVPSLGMRAAHFRRAAPVSSREIEIAHIYAQGETTPADICAQFGIKPNQLTGILLRTKTKRHPVGHFMRRPDADLITERCAELYRAGVSTADIARELGFKFQPNIYPLLRRAGIEMNRRPQGRLDAHEREVIAAYRSGKAIKEIAASFGVCAGTVTRLLRSHDALGSREEAERRRIEAVRAANMRRKAA
jgi:DNA-binding CsgD family transcriptional regulator